MCTPVLGVIGVLLQFDKNTHAENKNFTTYTLAADLTYSLILTF